MTTTFNRPATVRARKLGFRSGFEVKIAKQLDAAKIEYEYETVLLPYLVPEKAATYKPDFILSNGIFIEAKGLFQTKDRQKHLLIKKQHPDKDIRFVFSNSKMKISKKSKTTYGMWCEHNDILYADEKIPKEWLTNAEKKRKKK